MVNKMLSDASTFVEHLQRQAGTGPAVRQLKQQLKHFSKNELVRLCTATLIAKNILEGQLNDLKNPKDSSATPPPSSPSANESSPEPVQDAGADAPQQP